MNELYPTVILASGSPRRRALLDLAGIPYEARPVDVDETPVPGERPVDLVERLAAAKARALPPPPDSRAAAIVAADTVVVLDGAPLGKPRTSGEAAAMLAALSDRDHEVLTGVCLRWLDGRRPAVERWVTRTIVTFRPLQCAEIERYVACGGPLDKAGAYGIQEAAASFVEKIRGSYSNIVGLPLAQLCRRLLARPPQSHA